MPVPENTDTSPLPLENKSETAQQTANICLTRPGLEAAAANIRKREDKKKPSSFPIALNFIFWVNTEMKKTFAQNMENFHLLYTLPNVVTNWSCEEVHTFLTVLGFKNAAQTFLDHNVDGRTFLLLQPSEIYSEFQMKIGPAVKLLSFIERMRQEQIITTSTD